MTDIERFRLFIAVTIPEEVKAKIAEAQSELRRALPERSVRWTKLGQAERPLDEARTVPPDVEVPGKRGCAAGSGAGRSPSRRVPRLLSTAVERSGDLVLPGPALSAGCLGEGN